MKNNICITIVLILSILGISAIAQSPPVVMQWGTHLDIKKNNGSTRDWCYAIKETRDGGFIACGYSGHSTGSSVGPCIVKLDPKGVVVWHKEFDPIGIASFGVLIDIIETVNGNFAAVGEQQAANNKYRALLILTDALGNKLNQNSWVLPSRFAAGTPNEKAFNIVEAT